MASKFGALAKLDFLQDWVSSAVAWINPAIIHNVEKYLILKKVFYLSAIEEIEGDYLEFGVFTGSSFCHSIRCCRKLSRFNPAVLKTKFFGFDSFEGFGTVAADDQHPFYTDENFATSIVQVDRRVKNAASDVIAYSLVQGFFSDSLKSGVDSYGITKARIIFIDSDTYSSAAEAFRFSIPVIQEGTFFILDDYFSYKGSLVKGVARAFSEFIEESGIQVRQVFTYGMGGVVFVSSGRRK